MHARPRPPSRRSLRLAPGLALLLLLGAAAVSRGQESPGTAGGEEREEVFAPFVSRLKAVEEGSRILLTWRNPEGVPGARLVYRSTEAFSEDSFPQAVQIARLAPDVARYQDTPPSREAYFYAVLLEDPSGQPYTMFIPFRNVTSRQVRVPAQSPEEDLSAAVTEISARAVDDRVEVRFRSSREGRELLLFRSSSPIASRSDLVGAAAPVGLGPGTNRYLDYPIPGIGYYYCVLDAGLFKLGKAEPQPGRNATTSPVQIPLGVGRVGLPEAPSLRPTPLPFLLIQSAVDTGRQLAPPPPFQLPEPGGPLPPAVEAAVSRVLATAPPLRAGPRSFQVLSEDRVVEDRAIEDRVPGEGRPPGGKKGAAPGQATTDIGERAAARVLGDLVNAELVRDNPGAAALALEDFLRTRRPEALEQRAHFYLGQLYYLSGRYREAVLELLMARGSYYLQCGPWLDACFRELWSEEETPSR
jgi:hypothetical protein